MMSPDTEEVMEFDHPAGRAKFGENELHVQNMFVRWGKGVLMIMHASVV